MYCVYMKEIFTVYTDKRGGKKVGQGPSRSYQKDAFNKLMMMNGDKLEYNYNGYVLTLYRMKDREVASFLREDGTFGGFLSYDIDKANAYLAYRNRIVDFV